MAAARYEAAAILPYDGQVSMPGTEASPGVPASLQSVEGAMITVNPL